ncbi:MAG: hypothetical protein IJY08_03810 [Clostridia bacterium]|nr:hypothetical protein [Clostridia bacterium]
MIKKRSTLMKRRKIAIVVSVIAVIILAIALAVVLDYAKTVEVADPADPSAVYYIKYRDKAYALYDSDKKTLMPTEEQYGYYVMDSGTLVDLDAETGEYETIVVDYTVEGNEELGFNFRVLMFPHIEKKNIRKLEVSNSKGDFTFVRYNLETDKVDDSSDFIIEGSPLTSYDQEMFASLYVSAGYTLTTQKIVDPIKDANGEFSEYGLVPEIRPLYDEETGEPVMDEATGEQKTYEYVPAYYVLTDTSGNKYKVIVGDMLVTGGGYYVQYVDVSTGEDIKRDAVYVVSSDFGDTMLAAIEEFVTPALTYPMSMNTYFDVEDFFVLSKNYGDDKEENPYVATVGFTYIDLAERENTIKASEPYIFSGYTLDGYTPSSNNIDVCLQGMYTPEFAGVIKLSPSGEDLVKYGLAVPDGTDKNGKPKYSLESEHMISYNYDILDEDGNKVQTINNVVYISAPNKEGNRYAYTEIYSVDKDGEMDELMYTLDMIVEVAGHSLEFLNWDSFDWINDSYINLNIAFCDKITLKSPDYWAEFVLDNSASDTSETISSTLLSVSAKDSAGNDRKTFSQLEIQGKGKGSDTVYKWVITSSEIKCYDAAGTEMKISSAYYDYNMLDSQVRVISGYIETTDGSKVYVTADEVRIEALDPAKSVTYVRYDTNLFRQFYKTLLYATIVNSYQMTDEEKAEKITEENCMLTMTVLDSEGKENTYRFYRLTSRKAYITINGIGGFYVQCDRVQKFISDAQRFFANEYIEATDKR